MPPTNNTPLVPARTPEQDFHGLVTILTMFLRQLTAVYIFLNKAMEIILSGPEISLSRSCLGIFK